MNRDLLRSIAVFAVLMMALVALTAAGWYAVPNGVEVSIRHLKLAIYSSFMVGVVTALLISRVAKWGKK